MPASPLPDNMVFTADQFAFAMDVLRKELQDYRKNDPVNATQTAGNLHGLNPSGTLALFGYPGTNPRMFATVVRANGDFSRALEVRTSVMIRERVELLSGVTTETGTNPSNFCGDAVRPGALKVCAHDFEFGKLAASTDTVELPEVGGYYSYADVNRQIEPVDIEGPFSPDFMRSADQNGQTFNQWFKLNVALGRQWEKVIVQGNKNAAATGAGSLPFWFKQFEGIDRLIKTGYVDTVSNVACPAMDSRVVAFNANLTGTSTTFGSLVDAVTDAYMGMTLDLENMGYSLQAFAGAILIHPRMWQPLCRMWPCNYLTLGCDTIVNNNGERLNINAAEQLRMQEDMYVGRYLWINGMKVPVLMSWGVPISNVGLDLWTGSMYFVPFRLNGQLATFVEAFDMGNAQQEEFANIIPAANTRVINGGLYRIGRKEEPFCVEYKLAAKARLRFDAPFAAFRIDGITFQDRLRNRSPYTTESYHANGGMTSRGSFSY